MTSKDRVRFEMFIRVGQFIKDNAADFPSGNVIAAQAINLETVINALQALMGQQLTGRSSARFHTNSKATARENLRELLSDISATARSMVYQIPGIDLKFKVQRTLSNAELLAKARSFLADATPLKQEFIAFEMEADFLTDLQLLITDFDESMNLATTATGAHIEATADIGEQTRQGLVTVRTMDAAIKNKYRRDISKLMAWQSASHIERLPKPTETVTTVSNGNQIK